MSKKLWEGTCYGTGIIDKQVIDDAVKRAIETSGWGMSYYRCRHCLNKWEGLMTTVSKCPVCKNRYLKAPT